MNGERGNESSACALSKPKVLGLWLVSLILLLLFIGRPPVTRTQEARVLETSRQMLGTSVQGWLIPHINGKPRLEKPPLSYWMTATAYSLFRVGEGIGRIPVAIIGWLTLAIVYVISKHAFGFSPSPGTPGEERGSLPAYRARGQEAQKIALFSCASLLGSYIFFRHVRLAETDAPAMLFVTIAIGAIWRSASDPRARWFHLAAAAMGMAIMAKGAPAVFAFLFFLGFCAIERRWDLLRRFVRVGALVTFLVIALPWFVYIGVTLGFGTFLFELRNTSEGGNHFDWPTIYIPYIFAAAAPWSILLPFALYDAIKNWKTVADVRITLIWFLAILVPLCINGNKQIHYLLMLMPPTMILIGWRIARFKMEIQKPFIALLAIVPLFMPIIVGVVIPSYIRHNPRTTAAQIGQLGAKSYIFYGQNVSLTLCFNLRSAIPSAVDEKQLLQMSSPGTIVIAQTKNATAPPPLPSQFVHRLQVACEDQLFDCYEFEPNP
ncbi:MAG TPA: glycosyltransferase family 39 protein [Tepidisphaeraceae bacterium]|nr:glycosyltransferase family 39 protein [Tepidisphaeraceae bacterium]